MGFWKKKRKSREPEPEPEPEGEVLEAPNTEPRVQPKKRKCVKVCKFILTVLNYSLFVVLGVAALFFFGLTLVPMFGVPYPLAFGIACVALLFCHAYANFGFFERCEPCRDDFASPV